MTGKLSNPGGICDVRKLLKLIDADFGDRNAWDKKDVILKNKAEKLLIKKVWPPKTNPNKPKNKARKLLKTRSCGKNKPKTNPKTEPPILLKINES